MGEKDCYPPTNIPKIIKRNEESIYIATYNTLSLRTDESLSELLLALETVNWTILGMSEVRRLGEGIEDHGQFILYYIGETPGQYGVGFLVKKELKEAIIEFIGISERIAILNLKLPSSREPWSIVQVYSPTEQYSVEEIDRFYSVLSETIKEYTYKNCIIMGDFNAKIGNRIDGEEIFVGPFCSGKRSRNGEKLIQLACENNLKIMNSFYKNRKSNRWTWHSPDGRIKNEIDYILSSRSNIFQDCRVLNKLNFNSNHRMIRAKIKDPDSKKTRPFKIKSTSPMAKMNAENLQEELRNFKINAEHLNLQDKYNTLQQILTRRSATNKKTKKEQFKEWLSESTKRLIEDRGKLIGIPNKTKAIRQNIAQVSKEIKQNMRTDRSSYRIEIIEKCIQKTGGIKKATKELNYKKVWIPKMKNTKGESKTKRPEILTMATNFFKDLYSSKNTLEKTNLSNEEPAPEIMVSEVERAIKAQKKDKAPGADNITNEQLIENVEHLAPILTLIFNKVLRTEKIPEQWTSSTIILLHKKGAKDDINNYRPISLMSNIYKVFSKVVLNRISKALDENQPREQAGFRNDYSTIDHIHVVKQIFEKSREYKFTLYCCFVDYCKAFDSLEHEMIWGAMYNQGIQNKYIRILRNIYANSTAKVKLETEGKEIKIKRGVRQGDPISPKLFSAVLEEIFRRMDWKGKGLSINGEKLTHLRFADDLVVFSPTKEGLQEMLSDLDTESRKAGLIMNTSKTKIMTNGTEEPIVVGGSVIEYVSEYIYLGHLISTSDLMSKEIDRRIANAWKQYWRLRAIMKDKQISMDIKRKLFDTCILPVLTYGCQTWALNKSQIRKLTTCQNAMNRSMMGKKRSDKIRIETIRNHTKTRDVIVTIKKLKWKWAGHTVRGKDKWSKSILFWFLGHLRRKRGRPFRRWIDDIKKIAGATWTRSATDRVTWKGLEEAYAV